MPPVDAIPSPVFIQLDRGAPAELLGLTLPLAWKYLFLSFALALILEAFGKSPTEPRDYGAVVWRFLIVAFLLTSYRQVFGTVVNIASDLSKAVSPDVVATKLGREMATRAQGYWGARPSSAGAPAEAAASATPALPLIGSLLFQAMVGFLALLGLLAHRVIVWLAGVLVLLCYVVGPLALAFSVPRQSGIGFRWFSEFVSFCTWPVLSGLLLSLVSAMGLHLDGGSPGQSLESVAISLIFLLTGIATPLLAQRFIGGSVHQAIAHGGQTATSVAAGMKGAALAAMARMPSSTAAAATASTAPAVAAASPTVATTTPVNPPGGTP